MGAVCNCFHLNTPHSFKGTRLITVDCETEAIICLQDTEVRRNSKRFTHNYSRVQGLRRFSRFYSEYVRVYVCACVHIIPPQLGYNNIRRILTQQVNLLKPNDIYICCTAALTSRRYILNIYSTNIYNEYFKHAA